MDDDNTLNDTGAVSVEDLDETRAGKLLVHLAKQNAIGGRRNLFEHERKLIKETFSVVDKDSDIFHPLLCRGYQDRHCHRQFSACRDSLEPVDPHRFAKGRVFHPSFCHLRSLSK